MKRLALSEFVESLEPSVTFAIDEKVKEMQKRGIKVYNFNLGEPDFKTPDNVKEAVSRALSENKTRYTQVRGSPELLDAVCCKFRGNGIAYSPEEIIVSNGAKQALYLAVRTICGAGDEIIVLAPYWTSYPEMVRLAGGKPVIVRTDREGFGLSAAAIEKAITKKTKAIIINSPNNPTGRVYTLEELYGLAHIVQKRDILIISDEIYDKFLYGEARHYSLASIPELKEYTLTVNGVSKTYCMTGFRIGYCGGPAYIIEKMVNLQSHVSSNACSLSQAASKEALLGDQSQVQTMVSEFDRRRRFICGEFGKLGIDFVEPKGAYYVFFRVKSFGSVDFCEKALDDFQVALNPGETFGTPGWVRLSYTVDLGDLTEGIERIRPMLRRING